MLIIAIALYLAVGIYFSFIIDEQGNDRGNGLIVFAILLWPLPIVRLILNWIISGEDDGEGL